MFPAGIKHDVCLLCYFLSRVMARCLSSLKMFLKFNGREEGGEGEGKREPYPTSLSLISGLEEELPE